MQDITNFAQPSYQKVVCRKFIRYDGFSSYTKEVRTNPFQMNTYREKLSILSEMIAFAKVGKGMKVPEYNFLLRVSEQLGVEREVFDGLFDTKSDYVVPKTQAGRILQFHRLVLLMNVDQVQEVAEIERLRQVGLKMGLRPSAINQVLSIMHEYPDNIVPPEVLIGIFNAYSN